MSTHHFPIRVPDDMLEALGEYTGNFWADTLALEPFICEAIRDYMKRPLTAQKQAAAPSVDGYQWKQVFLPEGTKLRVRFDRKHYFAAVEGAEIQYGERAISPSSFANLHGSGNRNAWKTVWLHFPGSDEWLLAETCRLARKSAIARLSAGKPQGDDQPSHVAPRPPQEKGRGKGRDKDVAPQVVDAAAITAAATAPTAPAAPTVPSAPCTMVLGSGLRLEMDSLPSPAWLRAFE